MCTATVSDLRREASGRLIINQHESTLYALKLISFTKNKTSFWVAMMFNPSGIQTHTTPLQAAVCGWREGDGASRAAGALSLSDVSLLSEDPCVCASRSCFASTSVFPNDFCSSPVRN